MNINLTYNGMTVGYTFWDCGYCGDTAPKEEFVDGMYWREGDGKHQCNLCHAQAEEAWKEERASRPPFDYPKKEVEPFYEVRCSTCLNYSCNCLQRENGEYDWSTS